MVYFYFKINGIMKMIFERISEETRKISFLIYQKGWVCAGEGNLSVMGEGVKRLKGKRLEMAIKLDIDEINKKSVLITSKGARIRDLMENPERNLSLLKIQRNKVYLIKGKDPSTEFNVHLLCHKEILRSKLKENYLLHVHPVNIIAVSHLVKDERELNEVLENIHFEFKYIFPEGIGFTGEKEPGSLELAKETAEKISKYKCIIWKKHGIIVRGKNFEECYERIEIIEKLTEILIKLI